MIDVVYKFNAANIVKNKVAFTFIFYNYSKIPRVLR